MARDSAGASGAAADTAAAPDFDQFAQNMGRLIEEYGKVTAAYLKPIELGEAKTGQADEASDMVRTLGRVAERWVNDPAKIIEAQASLTGDVMSLWQMAMKRAAGEPADPVAKPDPRDGRFKDPDWSDQPVFDFIKQAYLIGSRWAETMVEHADGLDAHTKDKARFYIKQIAGALSPTNFIATNPELLRETLQQNGENLVRGLKMFAEDVEAGGGELKIRQSDPSRFEVGVNIATTPGKVIFRNDVMELIQYAPATPQVLKRPLLIVPPWINKFYILELNPEKSFIRWCVEQGLTVFCISWVNPDARHAAKDFESYMREGVFAALGAIEQATGEKKVTAIGYCVGGTLLAVTLAYMAATRDKRIDSATFFTTQVDFSQAGELSVFVDEDQIKAIEEQMARTGYLDGARMAGAFNMLRPNDLIWSYAVNNYLKGKAPTPFDLLYWNSDSTRMPAANHSFYLRNCYLDNKLSKGEMVVGGERLDLGKITVPIYNLATREDHIAPSASVFIGSQKFGGPVEHVVAGSGHIAGVVNPPAKVKYQYWTNGPAEGSLESWMASATEHPGSWWPHWFDWVRRQAPRKVKAREPGGGKLEPLADAPGTYVKIRV
ncbi:class I poly(R)-hydroxyalkanoic acid synthase [Bosea sp. (in: a-proteobacteria)]|uniref:class I poly(R)-hydroxyalkanoic acid synthase n=1 Tax=Bosea sp. (in: a-proteobacteria) TaxID=1871050 RepID=UPI003B3A0B06